MIEELITYMDRRCRRLAKGEGRIIEGFSMGDYGAARLGFKHPHLFVAAWHRSVTARFHRGPTRRSHERDRVLGIIYADDMRISSRRAPVAHRGAKRRQAAQRPTHAQPPGIPHNPNLVLETLGDDNWPFYMQAVGGLNSAQSK